MFTVKLTSGYKLEFDSLAAIEEHCPAWSIDFAEMAVWNDKTGTIVGCVVEGEM
jgi:hypothetical protein